MREEPSPLATREIIDAFEEEAKSGTWDGIQDAFEPIRSLVSGRNALVSEDTYEYYRTRAARIVSRVSVVISPEPWAFFCLAGGEFGAPRWIFMPNLQDDPQTELEQVSNSLRERLTSQTLDVNLDDTGAALLQRFLVKLDRAERMLLPTRKQRALDELEIIISKMIELAARRHDQPTVDRLVRILNAIIRPEAHAQPDLDEISARWLDLIRPIWYECLKRPRLRPLLLKDIRPYLFENEPHLRPKVLQVLATIPILQTPDERIAACIIGIP
jgi:hypothetical protein